MLHCSVTVKKRKFPLKICPAPGNGLLLQLARATEISICRSLVKYVPTWKTKTCYQLLCHLKKKNQKTTKVSESSPIDSITGEARRGWIPSSEQSSFFLWELKYIGRKVWSYVLVHPFHSTETNGFILHIPLNSCQSTVLSVRSPALAAAADCSWVRMDCWKWNILVAVVTAVTPTFQEDFRLLL